VTSTAAFHFKSTTDLSSATEKLKQATPAPIFQFKSVKAVSSAA
jgi:hypothetical protein